MPVRDFNIEAIDRSYDSIIVDTSALFFDICYKLNRSQVEAYNNADESRESNRKIQIPRKFLERTIDFNDTFSLFLESGNKFRIPRRVLREHEMVEWKYSRKIASSLIRCRLVGEYNKSVENMTKSLTDRLVSSDDPNLFEARKLMGSSSNMFGEGTNLSKTDQEIILYGLVSSGERDTVIITNDLALANECSRLKKTYKQKQRLDIYTNVKSDNFRIFVP